VQGGELALGGAGAALICASLCVANVVAQAPSPQLSDNVRAGGVDSRQADQAGSRIRRSRAVALLRTPVQKVTDAVLDYGAYRDFMPHFVSSRVLSRRGSQALVYVEVSALQGLTRLWAEMKMLMVSEQASTRVVRAQMVRGNLKGFEAEWQITSIDSTRTLVAFELCADPDFPLPFASGLVSDYNEIEARNSVLALRSHLLAAR